MHPKDLQNYFLLDVRTPQEFDQKHIPNSTLIPINDIPQNLNKLQRIQKTILIICRSGARASHVQDFLEDNQIESKVLHGGIIANPHLLE
jgi:rhodanese-related sulfurtransferase